MTMLRALLIIASLVIGVRAQAQDDSPFIVHKLRDNVFVLTRLWEPGQGNNMGVVVGEDGLLLINSMMANDSEALDAALKTLSDKPVKYIINSNWDFYNVLGNEYFAARGAMIIAQEDVQYAPRNPEYEPVYHQMLFKDGISFAFDGDRITAYRSGGHSFPHVNIRIEKANVTFMADSFRPDWFGVMGPWGLKGYLAGLDRALSESDEETLFVSGAYTGTPYYSRNSLIHEKTIRQAYVSRIGALYHQGKTVDDMREDPELNRIVAESFPDSMERFGGLAGYDILPTLSTEFMPEHQMAVAEKREYTGIYSLQDGLSFEVYLEAGTLFARSYGRFKVMLKPVSTTDFIFVGAQEGEKIVFEVNGQGAVVAVHPDLGESHLTRRIPAGRWLKQE